MFTGIELSGLIWMLKKLFWKSTEVSEEYIGAIFRDETLKSYF
jgi:hypothetical protein